MFMDVPPFLREHGDVGSGGVGPLVMVFDAPGSFYGRLFRRDAALGLLLLMPPLALPG
jgi:hypothetical protein